MRPLTPVFAVKRPSGGRQRGFTLVEALVMLAIVAMAALVAIPNLQRVMIKTQTTQAIAGLAGAFDLARSESLRRHSPVGAVITTLAAGNLAVIVWEDFDPSNAVVGTNGNGVHDGAELVVERRTVEPVIEFSPSPPTSITQVVYRSDGSLLSPGNGGMVHLQDQRGNLFRVRVNGVTGSTRLEMLIGSTWEGRREKWSWKY